MSDSVFDMFNEIFGKPKPEEKCTACSGTGQIKLSTTTLRCGLCMGTGRKPAAAREARP